MKNKKLKILLSTAICMLVMTSTVFASSQSLEVKNTNEKTVQLEDRSNNGWNRENNQWFYYNNNEMQTGWLKVNNEWFYLNLNGILQSGWIKVGDEWFYSNLSGVMQTGWTKVDNSWYYLNPSGAMNTGWIHDGYDWYYSNSSGAMQTGWLKLGNEWYYLNSSGVMQTGWLSIGGNWYHLNPSGAMQTNTVVDGWTIDKNGIASNATKPEKVYTGSSVKSSLWGMGFENAGNGAIQYIHDIIGRVAGFTTLSGNYDMRLQIVSNRPEVNSVVRQICNTVLPGHGGTLYNLANSGNNQSTTIGGRSVSVTFGAGGAVITIGPING